MDESPMIARPESGQQAKLKWNNHNSLIWTPIKMDVYPLER
jgi:hypothetical protein